MKFLILLLTSICGFASLVCSTNWCDKTLCPSSRGPHIACNHKRIKSANCPSDFKIIPFTQEFKNAALDKHNKLRNQQALGKIPNFGPAKRMATMIWDNKLAELAELNVMQCKLKHDSCRSTEIFLFAGQSLSYRTERASKQSILDMIDGWFSEHKYTTMNHIRKYPEYRPAQSIGHFAQIVRDEAYKIGCAMSQYTGNIDNLPVALMACNYAVAPMLGSPIYVDGPTASECKMGKNPNYPGLCSVNEKYKGPFFH